MSYVKKAGDPEKWIPKEELIPFAYYKGKCRNAPIAWWDGKKFHYLRSKFGNIFAEEIECPENDRGYDVFFAQEIIYNPRT